MQEMLNKSDDPGGSRPLIDRASNAADTARADDDGMHAPSASGTSRDRVAQEQTANDQLRDVRRAIAVLDADSLVEVIGLAYGRLGHDDPRRVRCADVELLRRLAQQAHAFDSSLIEHADQRRRVGERRGKVSPEAAHTAEWANRLADALDSLVSGRASKPVSDDARMATTGKS